MNLGDGIHYLPKSKAIVEYKMDARSDRQEREDYLRQNSTNSKDLFVRSQTLLNEYPCFWGFDNRKPQNVLATIVDNSITPGLINFKSLVAQSKGLMLYEEIIEGRKKIKVPVQDIELDDWIEELDLDSFIDEIRLDTVFLYNNFTEVILNRSGKRVIELNRLDSSNCRISNDKKYCYAYKSWEHIGTYYSPEYFFRLPLYDKKAKTPYHFVIHSKNKFTGSSHYGFAPWWGSLKWLEFANEIPKFKLKAIKNGFSIKYHIEIPGDYFEKLYPDTAMNPESGKPYNAQDRFKKEQSLRQQMDDFLAGSNNAHKSFLSKFAYWHDGKPLQGWKITPIKDETKYDAYIDDFNTSNQAVTSSHNVDPSISSINTQGSLSSGSDKRNSFNIMTEISVADIRTLLLNPINIAKKITFPNKNNIKIGFENIELTTTDLVKSGLMTDKIN